MSNLTKQKYTHVLWTLDLLSLEKRLILSGTMDFCTSCYKSTSEETFIKLSNVFTRILRTRVLLELEIVKRDLFNRTEVCAKAAF